MLMAWAAIPISLKKVSYDLRLRMWHCSSTLRDLIALMELRCKKSLMRKFFYIISLILLSLTTYAQKDVTQFLGISLDGTKEEMFRKLKAKGFRPNPYNPEVLEGEFNGVDVNLFVATNGDKVCRIMLTDVNQCDESSIRIRFNNLCRQFENNSKYLSLGEQYISSDEDISYGISVKKQRYEAIFYQRPTESLDSASLLETLAPQILSKYSPEELINPTEEINQYCTDLLENYFIELALKKSVWFMISDYYGKYYITMFYDNEYNRANGEDL